MDYELRFPFSWEVSPLSVDGGSPTFRGNVVVWRRQPPINHGRGATFHKKGNRNCNVAKA